MDELLSDDMLDEEEQEQQQQWVPAQLAATAARAQQNRADDAACRDKECQLCVILDNRVEGCAQFVRKIFEMEEELRNRVARDVLYRIITKRYNDTVYRRTLELYGPEKTRERGVFPLTIPMVRRHYEQGHAHDPARTLWEIVDYEKHCIQHLQEASLWVRNASDPSAAPQPNVANINVMIKLGAEIRANIVLAQRLDAKKPT